MIVCSKVIHFEYEYILRQFIVANRMLVFDSFDDKVICYFDKIKIREFVFKIGEFYL